MRGDFTRNTFDPKKHYSKVRQQQGRVQLDADWNEQVDIFAFIQRLTSRDVIGFAGGPMGKDANGDDLAGFLLEDTGGTITIKKGRYYVNGLLIQNEADVPLNDQPDLPDATPADLLNGAGESIEKGVYLAYLDVWERHLTALDDPTIREVALGGPDTTTRNQIVWQVFLKQIESPSCDIDQPTSNARMAARAQPDPATTDPCELPPGAGYRRLENQLYRVEIHDSGAVGTATFKWSRENGSVVTNWLTTDGDNVAVSSIGKDEALSFVTDSFVELSDDRHDRRSLPGIMAEVQTASGDLITIKAGSASTSPLPAPASADLHPKARRWEGFATVEVPATNGGWIELEDGVEIRFDPTSTYQTGDYWLIPARTLTGQVEWQPVESYKRREGIEHAYAPIAVLETDGEQWRRVRDCRDLFPPLTEIDNGCCIEVRPGEDVQRALEMVIAAGGGCVSLCAGVHEVDAPLIIRDAANVTLHGDNLSSVLVLNNANDDNTATDGIVIQNSIGIAFEHIFMVGRGVKSIVNVDPTDELFISADVAFRHLLMLNVPSLREKPAERFERDEPLTHLRDNPPQGEEEAVNVAEGIYDRAENYRATHRMVGLDGLQINRRLTCAIQLAHTHNITVADCRLFADVGILGLFGAVLPTFDLTADNPPLTHVPDNAGQVTVTGANYGEGVYDTTLERVGIRYNSYGVLVMKAVRWQVTRCDIQTYSADALKMASGTHEKIALRDGTVDEYRALQDAVNLLFLKDIAHSQRTPIKLSKGAAIRAAFWEDCRISDCELAGGEGVAVGVWLRGDASRNIIHAMKAGLRATWLHAATWQDNRIRSLNVGLLMGGTHRGRINHNRVRADVAVSVADSAMVTRDMLETIKLMAFTYPLPDTNTNAAVIIILWVLLEELTDYAGLRDFVNALDAYLKTLNLGVYSQLPALALLSAMIGTRLLREGLGDDRTANNTLPVIDLVIANNEMSAKTTVIELTKIIPLGGLKISHNRLHTTGGQAVRLDSAPYFANVHASNFLLRYLMQQLVETTLPNAIENLEDDSDSAERRAIFEALLSIATQWRADLRDIYGGDYAIETNTITSRFTAVETNIAETTVSHNHITLEEGAINRDEIASIYDALSKLELTAPMAVAFAQGSGQSMMQYATTLNNDTRLNTASVRQAVGDVAAQINNRSTIPAVKHETSQVMQAVSNNNRAELNAAIVRMASALRAYTDTQGILLRGTGCRALMNHILVPGDELLNTSARGGIQVAIEMSGYILLVLLKQLFSSRDLPEDHIFDLTGTVIDGNEITGGYGSGVDMLGTSESVAAAFDLKIRNNQIHGLGGAGIHINEFALVIGLDIENNNIAACGLNTSNATPLTERGGVIVKSSALVRIHDNRISRCGHVEQPNLYGVHLETIYSLSLEGNHILYNGGSQGAGVYLEDVVGEVLIADNQIAYNNGIGLFWQNLTANRGTSGTVWAYLYAGLTMYLQRKLAGGETGATTNAPSLNARVLETEGLVSSNQFRVLNTLLPAFEIRNIDQLTLATNTGRNQQLDYLPAFGMLINIGQGLVTGNNINTDAQSALYIENMSTGVIDGNLGNKAIRRRNSSGVTIGTNRPNVQTV